MTLNAISAQRLPGMEDDVSRLTAVIREARDAARDEYERTGFPAWSELYLFLNAAAGDEEVPLPLPDRAHARNTDPSTSHLAAASIDDLSDRHWNTLFILDFLGNSTDEELVRQFDYARKRFDLAIGPQSGQSIRTRRKELERAGHVEWTGEYRKTLSGRRAKVWRAKEPIDDVK